MERVIFDGKEYVKASVLATRFRYTADYLGQLCRGKKVDARLVGRAWYINLDSLNVHRSGRYKNLQVKEKEGKTATKVPIVASTKPVVEVKEEPVVAKTENKLAVVAPIFKKPSSNYLSRIDVEPVLKEKTVKIMRSNNGTLLEVPMRYEKDDYSLIPRVNKSAVSAEIHVMPAEAERLKIYKEPKKFNIVDFKAEALPEVFLSGRIKVDGLLEATEEPKIEEPEETTASLDITSKIKPNSDINGIKTRLVSLRKPIKKTEILLEKREVDSVLVPRRPPVLIRRPMPLMSTRTAGVRPLVATEPSPFSPPKTPEVPVNRPTQAPKTAFDVARQRKPVVVALGLEKTPIQATAPTAAKSEATLRTAKPVGFIPVMMLEEEKKATTHFGWGSFFLILVIAIVLGAASLLTATEVRVEHGFYNSVLTVDTSAVNQLFDIFRR
jgi:hypothetical protein